MSSTPLFSEEFFNLIEDKMKDDHVLLSLLSMAKSLNTLHEIGTDFDTVFNLIDLQKLFEGDGPEINDEFFFWVFNNYSYGCSLEYAEKTIREFVAKSLYIKVLKYKESL